MHTGRRDHRPLPIQQILFKSEILFVNRRTYGQMYGQTLRLASLDRLRGVNMKTKQKVVMALFDRARAIFR